MKQSLAIQIYILQYIYLDPPFSVDLNSGYLYQIKFEEMLFEQAIKANHIMILFIKIS